MMGEDPRTTPLAAIEKAVFEAALALEDSAARSELLRRAFQGDPGGRERMERLLEAVREAVPFFLKADEACQQMAEEILAAEPCEEARETGQTAAPCDEEPGTTIGRYRLIKRLGQGGGGVVYEAEQLEPVVRRVALKIVHVGMDTKSVIARFEAERQALALMDHPNIAKVLDAGTTAMGRPYFVMDLVCGERITSYCDSRQLGIEQRMELFLQVCHAIQHAHHKGIIHRDIKPSNVIVSVCDGTPIPKVIDFGIAKATHWRISDQDTLTLRDQPIGTPAYMSPEQVDMSGIDVDTRSDVYSLGVLLYELLTGSTPFDGELLAKSGMLAMRRTLLECEPPVPSALLARQPPEQLARVASARRLDPAALLRRVRGELDWIAAKALEKNRNRRYQTANSVAAEVQRFLENEPVLARRPSRMYSLQKFVIRNRTACISGLAIAISLVAGLGMSTWMYFRERDALWEQKRLSRETEAARFQEAHLREQAQARANLSRVAVLLSEGQLEQADALLMRHPLESVEPSREAAGVFRSLGDWYALYGRWDQAVRCFVLLNQANKLDDPRKIIQGSDLLASAPALVEHGDERAYEKFRKEVLDLYLPGTSTFEAEHLLKICLLRPAKADTLGRLGPTAALCSKGMTLPAGVRNYPEWDSFSLALYALRLGDYEAAIARSALSLAGPDNIARKAATRGLTAIAHYHLGEYDAASRDLSMARDFVAEFAEKARSSGTVRVEWFDLAVARILLREAEETLTGKALAASE